MVKIDKDRDLQRAGASASAPTCPRTRPTRRFACPCWTSRPGPSPDRRLDLTGRNPTAPTHPCFCAWRSQRVVGSTAYQAWSGSVGVADDVNGRLVGIETLESADGADHDGSSQLGRFGLVFAYRQPSAVAWCIQRSTTSAVVVHIFNVLLLGINVYFAYRWGKTSTSRRRVAHAPGPPTRAGVTELSVQVVAYQGRPSTVQLKRTLVRSRHVAPRLHGPYHDDKRLAHGGDQRGALLSACAPRR